MKGRIVVLRLAVSVIALPPVILSEVCCKRTESKDPIGEALRDVVAGFDQGLQGRTRSFDSGRYGRPSLRMTGALLRATAAALACCLFALLDLSSVLAAPATSATDTASVALTVMTYNIHHAEGADGRVDLERIARIIRAHDPDLVALQEIDRFTRRAPMDQVERLAALTGLEAEFGFTLTYQGGDYGVAVLSRWAPDSVYTIPLPGLPDRYEPRLALAVDVRVPCGDGKTIALTFIGTHFDVRASSRLAMLPRLERFTATRPERAHVLAGDLNAVPDEPTLVRLTEGWTNVTADRPQPTYPAAGPERQLDYVLVRPAGLWVVESAGAVNAPHASDHLPLVARLRLHAPASR